MPSVALACSLVVLAVALVAVVRAPGGRPEVLWTAPAALLVLVTGLVSGPDALDTVRDLLPTLAFLAAMFVLARLADAAGLFAVAARLLGRAGARGGTALLVAVAAGTVTVTTVLSLDATAVLFTPVVVAATRGRTDRDQALLATVFLSNGASLLLPVANLTNLLAQQQIGLPFPAFAARMALPTVLATVVTTLGCRLLVPMRPAGPAGPAGTGPEAGRRPTADPVTLRPDPAPRSGDPGWVAAGLGLLMVAFVVASLHGIAPAVVAAAGAVVMVAIGLARRTVAPGEVARSVDVAFLAFVATLGVVVAAPATHGLTRFVGDRLPAGTGLGSLLLVAFGAALLANLVTNLPATLVLLPALAGRDPSFALAALLGVNIGPNLTTTGSLATLLWRRVVRAEGAEPPRSAFVRTTVVTTPVALAAATVGLWITLQVL